MPPNGPKRTFRHCGLESTLGVKQKSADPFTAAHNSEFIFRVDGPIVCQRWRGHIP
jgi:hypothetical protein